MIPLWLTEFLAGSAGKLLGALAIPAAIGLAGMLAWVSISDGVKLRSLRSENTKLSDSIHGGEPGYAVEKPGYIVQIQRLRGIIADYKRNEVIFRSNEAIYKNQLAAQSLDVQNWRNEGLLRKGIADKAVRALEAERVAGQSLAREILALRATGNPAFDADGYILRVLQ